MTGQQFYRFASHIQDENAKVSIYADRIELAVARGVSGAKLTAVS